jgi:hypothetical protein
MGLKSTVDPVTNARISVAPLLTRIIRSTAGLKPRLVRLKEYLPPEVTVAAINEKSNGVVELTLPNSKVVPSKTGASPATAA